MSQTHKRHRRSPFKRTSFHRTSSISSSIHSISKSPASKIEQGELYLDPEPESSTHVHFEVMHGLNDEYFGTGAEFMPLQGWSWKRGGGKKGKTGDGRRDAEETEDISPGDTYSTNTYTLGNPSREFQSYPLTPSGEGKLDVPKLSLVTSSTSTTSIINTPSPLSEHMISPGTNTFLSTNSPSILKLKSKSQSKSTPLSFFAKFKLELRSAKTLKATIPHINFRKEAKTQHEHEKENEQERQQRIRPFLRKCIHPFSMRNSFRHVGCIEDPVSYTHGVDCGTGHNYTTGYAYGGGIGDARLWDEARRGGVEGGMY